MTTVVSGVVVVRPEVSAANASALEKLQSAAIMTAVAPGVFAPRTGAGAVIIVTCVRMCRAEGDQSELSRMRTHDGEMRLTLHRTAS